MNCVACGRGFHKECIKGCKNCHPKEEVKEQKLSLVEAYKKRGKTAKDLKDAHSTGRKRAAKLYPLDSSEPCEWRSQKNCGGGRYPIIGCFTGLQQARHHGPVKDTTRNQSGNVHRICNSCHNHWHELNDPSYNQSEFGLLPHDPEPATESELVGYAFAWKSGEIGRKYTLASSENKKKYKITD